MREKDRREGTLNHNNNLWILLLLLYCGKLGGNINKDLSLACILKVGGLF